MLVISGLILKAYKAVGRGLSLKLMINMRLAGSAFLLLAAVIFTFCNEHNHLSLSLIVRHLMPVETGRQQAGSNQFPARLCKFLSVPQPAS